MQSILDATHVVMRWSHIAAGFVGLMLFWIPICARKGSKLHTATGKVFLWLATYVSVTAVIASCWGVLWPLSFMSWRVTDIPLERRDAVLSARVEDVRFLMLILLFLSVAVLAGVVFGRQAIRTRQDHARLRSPLLVGLELAMGIASLLLLGMGATKLLASGDAPQQYWIHVALGGFGLFAAWSDLRYILGPQPGDQMSWLYKHVESMIGVGIGFHTAFAVIGFRWVVEYAGWEIEGIWLLIPWIAPSIVGIPAAAIWIHRLKQQSGIGAAPATEHPKDADVLPPAKA